MNDRRVCPPGGAPIGGGRLPATMATQTRHQAPMASYAPRPVGQWRALRTADGKHVYYHNAATNVTTWTRPPDYVDPGPPSGTSHAPGSVGVAPSAASAPSSVTQIPVPGTTWYEVTQPGKPSYFHDAATRAVVWAPPPAVLEARRRRAPQRAPGQAPRRDATETTRKRAREEAPAPGRLEEGAEAREEAATRADPTRSRRAATERTRERAFVAPSPELTTDTKHEETLKKHDETVEDDEELYVEFDPDAYEIDDAVEDPETEELATAPTESDAERAAREFRELLTEKGVDATSRWDRKAREISGDPRFKAVRTHAERRRLFERHARDAGDAAADKKKNAAGGAAAARAASSRARKEALARAHRSRELADANVARLRARNAREVAVANFETLLAESEKKWDLAASAPPAYDDARLLLRADAQGRATAVPGAFEDADMRALFEAHVARAIRARVADVAALLDEKLDARGAEDFERQSCDEDADEDADGDGRSGDGEKKKNPLASFAAARAFAPLASDPRWDRCPLEQRASAYCRRVETLCAELNVEDVPEEVAALRDALAEAREKRLAGVVDDGAEEEKEKGGEDPEDGEAVDDGGDDGKR